VAAAVVMPKFGQTMTEGTIVSWERKPGDVVRKGEVILRIETDKSEMDVEADEAGILLRIDADPGALVPCGTVIAWLGEKGETL
jgi:pyruvate/2-oxoglutarate dehydrogenase complex dihydrolipoamide acyltransferase (E2) component